jgi:hypothetical protein
MLISGFAAALNGRGTIRKRKRARLWAIAYKHGWSTEAIRSLLRDKSALLRREDVLAES